MYVLLGESKSFDLIGANVEVLINAQFAPSTLMPHVSEEIRGTRPFSLHNWEVWTPNSKGQPQMQFFKNVVFNLHMQWTNFSKYSQSDHKRLQIVSHH